MNINDKEKLEVQNLIKLIKRAKFDDFQGIEALALARAYHWLNSLLIIVPPAAAPLIPIEDKKIEIIPEEKIEKPKKVKKDK